MKKIILVMSFVAMFAGEKAMAGVCLCDSATNASTASAPAVPNYIKASAGACANLCFTILNPGCGESTYYKYVAIVNGSGGWQLTNPAKSGSCGTAGGGVPSTGNGVAAGEIGAAAQGVNVAAQSAAALINSCVIAVNKPAIFNDTRFNAFMNEATFKNSLNAIEPVINDGAANYYNNCKSKALPFLQNICRIWQANHYVPVGGFQLQAGISWKFQQEVNDSYASTGIFETFQCRYIPKINDGISDGNIGSVNAVKGKDALIPSSGNGVRGNFTGTEDLGGGLKVETKPALEPNKDQKFFRLKKQ